MITNLMIDFNNGNKMKSFRSVLAAISITWAIVFSCRLVMVATPLSVTEQIALVLTMVEYSFLQTKKLGKEDEKTEE